MVLPLFSLLLCCTTSSVMVHYASGFAAVPEKKNAFMIVLRPQDDSLVHQTTSSVLSTSSSSAKSTTLLPIWKMALAGCMATMLSDAAMHPMDCIKTLQQSDEGSGLNLLTSVGYLYQQYGIAGFYHGMGTYALSDGGGGALKFATYESLKQIVIKSRLQLKQNQQDAAMFACAAIAFVVSSLILVPGEFLKQQLQMGTYPNLWDAFVTVKNSDNGIQGFFTGYDGVCYRDVPYTAIELGLYDLLKNHYDLAEKNKQFKPSSWQKEAVAAAITGGVAAFMTTPLDTIKTKVMVDSYYGGSFFHCLVQTVQHHGPTSLFAGAGARVAWLIPFTALYLPLYDYIKRTMMLSNIQNDGD